MQEKYQKLIRRHKRVRAKIKGTKDCPRLSVFRSNRHLYVQLIDDETGKTILSKSDLEKKASSKKAKTAKKKDVVEEIGQNLAEGALKKEIKKVVFDRGGYKYHGKVEAVAKGARKGGLKF